MGISRYRQWTPEIHATAFIHPDTTIIGNVKVGAESSVWPHTTLRGDDGRIVVGDQTSIQDGSVVHLTTDLSNTFIGNRVTIGHNVIAHGCTIGDECIIGMGAILLDNCKIGRHVIVGAGTVIPMRKEIPDGVLVVGNPFKIIREIEAEDLRMIEFSWKSYAAKARNYAVDTAPAP